MAETAWFTYDDFADRVGEHFRVRLADGPAIDLTLIEATASAEAGGPGPDGSPRQQFSLVFRGPREPTLAQGIRDLGHDTLQGVVLFLVPIGIDDEGARYEAAFA